MARRWLVGFDNENPFQAEQQQSGTKVSTNCSRCPRPRDPSLAFQSVGAPVLSGIGFAHRSPSNTGVSVPTQSIFGNISALQEVFWFRVRRLPTTESQFYGATWTTGGQQRIMITMDQGGFLRVRNQAPIGAAFPGTQLGSSIGPVSTGVWMLGVISYYYSSGGGTISNFVDVSIGVPGGQQIGTAGGAFQSSGANSVQVSSGFGANGANPGGSAEIDVDDWYMDDQVTTQTGATSWTRPTGGALPAGGPIYLVRPVGIGTYNSWTGDPSTNPTSRIPQYKPSYTSPTQDRVSSSTALQKYSVALGSLVSQGICSAKALIAGFQISLRYDQGAPIPPATATVFIRVNGVEFTFAAASTVGGSQCFAIVVDNPGNIYFTATDQLEVGYQHANNASLEQLCMLTLEVQVPTQDYTFIPPGGSLPVLATYPTLAQLLPQDTTIQVAWGTYVGNGTAQFVNVGFFPHWLSIMQSNQGAPGKLVWESRMGPSAHDNGLIQSETLPSLSATGFTVASAAATINSGGTTYFWVAIRDPQQRAFTSGASNHVDADPSQLTALDSLPWSPGFVPGYQMCRVDDPSSNTQTWYHYLEGGNCVEAIQGVVISTALSSIAGLTAGTYKVGSTLFFGAASNVLGAALAMWRFDQFTSLQLWNAVSYTGDGTNNRVIAIPLTGLTPIWMIVTSNNADGGVMRDASMTTNRSYAVNGGVTTTGILALGPNQFTIHSSFNVTGKVYQAFAIAGLPATSGLQVDPGPAQPTGQVGNGQACLVNNPLTAGGGEACSVP